MPVEGKGKSLGSRGARSGSVSGAQKPSKRQYELVSPTTPEGQVTLANIKMILQEAMEPVWVEIDRVNKKLDEIAIDSARVGKLEQTVEDLSTKVSDSELKCKDLEEKVIMLELYSRKNNLKFLNMKETNPSNYENCEGKILDLCSQYGINIDIRDIERAHRVGQGRKFDRPIMVKFNNYRDKLKILKEKQKFQNNGVRVIEDFPVAIQERRRVFAPILQEVHRLKGKYRGRLIRDKLLVDGKLYSTTDLNKLPEDLRLCNISTRTSGDMIAFFTKNSKFSNHFPCNFTHGGTKFSSVEQFLMLKKAETFKDDDTADQIMRTSDPILAKSLGKRVKNFQQEIWAGIQNAHMKEGLSCKFQQDQDLKQALKETGKKTLVEANPNDNYWGTGISINDDNIWDQKQWRGQNMLGKLLAETL